MLNPGRVGTGWLSGPWLPADRGVTFGGRGQARHIATYRAELGLLFVLILYVNV